MRVLLINPNRERVPFPVPPLGLCLVASAAEDAGHDVRLLDLCLERRPHRALIDALGEFHPEAIGITIRNVDNTDCQHPVFYLEEITRDVIRLCREISPAPIVLGGAGFSILPQEVLSYTGCEFGVVGDGERPFVRMLECLARGKPPTDVPGLVRRRPDGAVHANPPDHIEDLDALSPADVGHWVDIKAYERQGGGLNLQTKRGCQFHCVYCVYQCVEGTRYRLRSPASIAHEVEEAVSAVGPSSIEFTDSTFNVPLDHAEAVCEALAERRLPVKLQTSGINPGFVTPSLLRVMERAGFAGMMITPESASDPVLKGLGKTFTRDDLVRAAGLLGAADMARFWFFLLGGPGETLETVRETFDFIETHIGSRDLVFFATGIRVYPGTDIWRVAVDEGVIAPDQDLLQPTAYFSSALDPEALCDLVNREACAHSNWVETVDGASHGAGRLATQALALLGCEPPFWPKIPLYNSVVGLLGVRRRLRRRRPRPALLCQNRNGNLRFEISDSGLSHAPALSLEGEGRVRVNASSTGGTAPLTLTSPRGGEGLECASSAAHVPEFASSNAHQPECACSNAHVPEFASSHAHGPERASSDAHGPGAASEDADSSLNHALAASAEDRP